MDTSTQRESTTDPQPATIVVDASHRYVDASPAACRILGVTLDELRTHHDYDFSPVAPDPAEASAFSALVAAARDEPFTGETTVRRLDGTLVPVRFAMFAEPAGGYALTLEVLDDRADGELRMSNAGRALGAWRAAERQLDAATPGSPAWALARADARAHREEYRRAFGKARGPDST